MIYRKVCATAQQWKWEFVHCGQRLKILLPKHQQPPSSRCVCVCCRGGVQQPGKTCLRVMQSHTPAAAHTSIHSTWRPHWLTGFFFFLFVCFKDGWCTWLMFFCDITFLLVSGRWDSAAQSQISVMISELLRKSGWLSESYQKVDGDGGWKTGKKRLFFNMKETWISQGDSEQIC